MLNNELIEQLDKNATEGNKHIWNSDYWQDTFNRLEKSLGCDRITIRVCGDKLDDIKPNPQSKIYTTGHRILLAYHGYAYPGEDPSYAGPLSLWDESKDKAWYRSGKIVIVEDVTQPHEDLSEPQRDLLKHLQSWIGFGLHHANRLVGLVTIDYIESRIPTEKVSAIQKELELLADDWAKKIHDAYEQRKQAVQTEVAKIADEHYELSEIFKELTSILVAFIDKERLLVNSCEIFREETNNSQKEETNNPQKEDASNSEKMRRWYPEQPERVLKGKSVALYGKNCSIIKHNLTNPDSDNESADNDNSPTTDRLRSILAVPIKTAKDDLIAVITVSSIKPNVFCWYDVEMVQEAINTAKVAIERGWILDSLHYVIQKGLYETDRKVILEIFFNALKELVNFEKGFITLISDNRIYDENVKDENAPDEKLEIIHCYPDDDNTQKLDSIPKSLVQSIKNHTMSPKCDLKSVEFEDMTHAIAIQHKKYLLGILFLNLQNSAKDAKDVIDAKDAKRKILERFAEYLSMALYHQHLHDLQQRFDDACLRVLECFTFQDMLRMIARMARELVDATVGYVVLVEPNRVDLRVATTSSRLNYHIAPVENNWIFMNLDGSDGKKIGLTGTVINDRQSTVLNDVPNHVNYRPHKKFYIPIPVYPPHQKDPILLESELVVAMLVRDQNRDTVAGIPALGAINLQHESEGYFHDFHQHFIEKFALFAATIIQRYNLPSHPHFNIDHDPTKDTDIFFALKFSPERRRRVLEKWVKDATELAGKDSEHQDSKSVRRLMVKSADVSGAIGSGIWTYIARCEILIADMSGDSVNVFYEIGLAHALNKPVILICDENTKPPADLAGITYVQYDYYDEHNERFIQNLAREIRKVAIPNPETYQGELKVDDTAKK